MYHRANLVKFLKLLEDGQSKKEGNIYQNWQDLKKEKLIGELHLSVQASQFNEKTRM